MVDQSAVYRWEMLRRSVTASFGSPTGWSLHAPQPIREATLLLLRTADQPTSLRLNGQAAQGRHWNVYGFDFDAVTTELAGEIRVEVAGNS